MELKKIRTRGYLPHWEAKNATYSVVFRLADSLPQTVLDAYLLERNSILDVAQTQQRPLTTFEQSRLEELFHEKIDKALDQGIGACHLSNPPIGQLVFDALHFFDTKRYDLHACCVMPNHVHVMFTPFPDHGLDDLLHSWKSFTATKANRILATQGTFWMREYYDHIIRDQAEFNHAHQYILNNPVNAGLQNWKWVK